jgi:hypothetical protein
MPCLGDIRGKSESSQAAVMEFAQQFRRDGHLVLFRGQADLTPQVLSSLARKGGISESEKGLETALQKEEARSTEIEAWLVERRAHEKVREMVDLQVIYQREEDYLENTSFLERAALQHTQFTNNDSCFISTSTSVNIAMGDYQGGSRNRFVYVLSVPEDKAIDVRKAFTSKDPEVTIRSPSHMLLREEEYMILHDATKFIAAVIDLKDGQVYEPQHLAVELG